jgi:hypothetical protein
MRAELEQDFQRDIRLAYSRRHDLTERQRELLRKLITGLEGGPAA